MTERESGYYWVRENAGEIWQPADWTGCVWFLPGDERSHYDSDLHQIGPRIEEPDSPAYQTQAERIAELEGLLRIEREAAAYHRTAGPF